MSDGLEFSCLGRAKVNDSRRDQILSGLNGNYNHLSSEIRPEGRLLLGENLEGARFVESANRLCKKFIPSCERSL